MTVQESDSPALDTNRPDIEIVIAEGDWPQGEWQPMAAVLAAFSAAGAEPESLTISLSDDAHLAELNKQFRNKAGPTNVLSFPFEGEVVGEEYLGDIAIAYETVSREAEDEGISIADRASHMIVHGVLHLLGYDHQNNEDAEAMEALEARALGLIGISNPYAQVGSS